MLTRKYYKMIARVIKDNTRIVIFDNKTNASIIDKDNLLNDISIEFKKDNTLFNRDKFVKACND